MTTEECIEQLERRVTRYRTALVLVVVIQCAIGVMGATGQRAGSPNLLVAAAKTVMVLNDAGVPVVLLSSNEKGDGLLKVLSNEGRELVVVGPDSEKKCGLRVSSNDGQERVYVGVNAHGGGHLSLSSMDAKGAVTLTSGEVGGSLSVGNKTGREVIQAYVDNYGGGVVRALNCSGKGRSLTPGP